MAFLITRQMKGDETQQPIEYTAPPLEQVESLTRTICRGMAQRRGEHWTKEKTINEFSLFLKTVIRIQLKHKNRQQQSQGAKS